MRQLLMLGFYCEVYRREPRCRVYVNDILVDEFNIPHTPKSDAWTDDMALDPRCRSKEQFELQFSPPFLKFLELDNVGDRSLDLKVEIHNDDNNYTNGFMTQYTRVMMCQCWLVPIKVYEKFDQIQDRWKFGRNNYYGYYICKRSIAHYYSGIRNILENFALFANMHFADITQGYQSTEQYNRHSNYHDLPKLCQYLANKYWIGSSGYLHLTLKKKLGFWRHSTDRRRGWFRWVARINIKDLYDKYKHHEDQRNTDQ